jgi:hypothetical protein
MPNAGQTVKPQVALPKDPSACWPYLGPLTPEGHGKKTYCGRQVMAHRWMWEVLFGAIPARLVVYRTCDRKDCVNPHHLRLGTQAEANRAGIGATLTPQDVAEIRRHRNGDSRTAAAELATRMGVSAQTVRDIWRGGSWGRARPNHGPKRSTTTAA